MNRTHEARGSNPLGSTTPNATAAATDPYPPVVSFGSDQGAGVVGNSGHSGRPGRDPARLALPEQAAGARQTLGELTRRQSAVVQLPGSDRAPARLQLQAMRGGLGDPLADRLAL
jgi:hypothetical protein